MSDIVIRFLIGGSVVSLFAVCGSLFQPKSFAGLFGAAPSVAIATLGLTVAHQGAGYAALEARSMISGAVAFFVYACAVSWRRRHSRTRAMTVTLSLLPLWFGCAFGLWYLWHP
jgi:uncharacterized membrane protein (GlpM family)